MTDFHNTVGGSHLISQATSALAHVKEITESLKRIADALESIHEDLQSLNETVRWLK